ncbi:MAG: hypothetical protein HRU70_07930 [Phycisphaeraceae bacterium]|nr:MAG: hypothetical protein HRU70_07930 [Phycisphaeraceae bacterium]
MNPLIPNFPPPPPLPDAPWLPWLLVEGGSGWTAVVLLIVAGVVFAVLNRLGKPGRGARVAAVFALLAAGAVAADRLVTTDREALSASTRALVAAASSADRPALERLLADRIDIRLTLVPDGLTKPRVIDEIERLVSRYRVGTWAILDTQADPQGVLGRTQVLVRVESADGWINFSWWAIGWARGSDGRWTAATIIPLRIQGMSNPSR